MKINELTNVQIFCDLDGVLADFDKGVKDRIGKLPHEVPQGVLWAALGDQTFKVGSNHHIMMKYIANENITMPQRYQDMVKVRRGLYASGMLDSNELTNDGLEALERLNQGQDFTIEKNFYADLEWMPDGKQLWNHVNAMGAVIVTGLPHGNWAAPQKRIWTKRELGLGNDRVLTGMARDKAKLAADWLGRPLYGDVLIDDRPKHQAAWEHAGGKWITHTSAANSIQELENYLGKA